MDRQPRNQSGKLSGALELDNLIHYIMAFVGGYIGAYSIFGWGGLFALAQTANMIQLVGNLVAGDFCEMMLRLTAVCITCTAVLFAMSLQKRKQADLRKVSILLDMIVVAAESIISESTDRFLALYPVFFVMTFQWCIFSKTGGYGSSTVFSTNNLRQCVSSYGEYYMEGGEKSLKKAQFFRNTLITYHLGVFVFLLIFRLRGEAEVLPGLVPLVIAWLLLKYS